MLGHSNSHFAVWVCLTLYASVKEHYLDFDVLRQLVVDIQSLEVDGTTFLEKIADTPPPRAAAAAPPHGVGAAPASETEESKMVVDEQAGNDGTSPSPAEVHVEEASMIRGWRKEGGRRKKKTLFVPHITVAKIGQKAKGCKATRKLHKVPRPIVDILVKHLAIATAAGTTPSSEHEMVDDEATTFPTLDLCALAGADDGYYRTIYSRDLSKSAAEAHS